MQEFASVHPDRVTLHQLGIPHRGRPILALHLIRKSHSMPGKFLNLTEQDELAASEVSLDFIQYIYDNIDETEVSEWLHPMNSGSYRT